MVVTLREKSLPGHAVEESDLSRCHSLSAELPPGSNVEGTKGNFSICNSWRLSERASALVDFFEQTGQLGERRLFADSADLIGKLTRGDKRVGVLMQECQADSQSSTELILGSITFQRTPIFRDEFLSKALQELNAGASFESIYERIVRCFPKRWSVIEEIGEKRLSPSDSGFLVYLTVADEMRGRNASLDLVRGALDSLREDGLRYAVAYARVPQMRAFMEREFPELSHSEEMMRLCAESLIHEYASLTRDKDDLHPDWGIRFHQKGGAKVICGLPSCSLDDDSLGQGAFMLYDLNKI